MTSHSGAVVGSEFEIAGLQVVKLCYLTVDSVELSDDVLLRQKQR